MKTLGLGWLAFSLSILLVAAQAQETYGQPDAPVVAEVLGTKIHTRDPAEMRAVIIGKLVDRYAAEQGIAVEPEESDAYLDSLRRVAEQDRRRQERAARNSPGSWNPKPCPMRSASRCPRSSIA